MNYLQVPGSDYSGGGKNSSLARSLTPTGAVPDPRRVRSPRGASSRSSSRAPSPGPSYTDDQPPYEPYPSRMLSDDGLYPIKFDPAAISAEFGKLRRFDYPDTTLIRHPTDPSQFSLYVHNRFIPPFAVKEGDDRSRGQLCPVQSMTSNGGTQNFALWNPAGDGTVETRWNRGTESMKFVPYSQNSGYPEKGVLEVWRRKGGV